MSQVLESLEERIKRNSLPAEAADVALARLSVMRSAQPESFDYIDSKHYLDELLTFPWEDRSAGAFDGAKAREVLDLGVYGPRKIPDEITDYFAAMTGEGAPATAAEWPVPVLLGPVGIGKRTLARRFGQVTGRPVEVIQLELTENDSDLFGMPNDRVRGRSGSIVQALNRTNRRDAIIVLAGIEWAVRSWQDHGLHLIKFLFDPAERSRFRDRFLDVEMDLSPTLFVLTALALDVLPPEVAPRAFAVEWAGYTKPRKVERVSTSIMPKLLERYSLATEEVQIVDEGVESIIDEYTNDAGFEQVEIILDILCRKAVAARSSQKSFPSPVDSEAIQHLLGAPRRYRDQIQALVRPGMAKGIALSAEGAAVETVEIAVVPGSEGFGPVGSVNEATAKMIDLSYHYIRSRMTEMDISARQLYEYAYRVNLPGDPNEVSVQSLGLAVVVAFLSQIRDRLVDPELALVGEMTLNGRVIGSPGLQHILLAAHRSGIRRIVIPGASQQDVYDLPPDLTGDIAIIPVDDAEQAIRVALE